MSRLFDDYRCQSDFIDEWKNPSGAIVFVTYSCWTEPEAIQAARRFMNMVGRPAYVGSYEGLSNIFIPSANQPTRFAFGWLVYFEGDPEYFSKAEWICFDEWMSMFLVRDDGYWWPRGSMESHPEVQRRQKQFDENLEAKESWEAEQFHRLYFGTADDMEDA